MSQEVFESIKEPKGDLEYLYRKAKINVERDLANFDEYPEPDPDDRALENLAFTFHYDCDRDEDPDYMLIFEDPGMLGSDRHERVWNDQFKHLESDRSPQKWIEGHRQIVISWLTETVRDGFTEAFCRISAECELIDWELEDVMDDDGDDRDMEAFTEAFFGDFYYTNTVKYRDASHGKTEQDESFEQHLGDEISQLDPELIFVFGSTAWSTVRRNMEIQPPDDFDGDEGTLRDVHGGRFRAEGPEGDDGHRGGYDVIPGYHPSARGNNWSDSELERRLRDSLESWGSTGV